MRHADIERIYKNHFFTAHRNMGGVRELVGSIDVIVFFVNDSQSIWTDYAKRKYRRTQKAAMQEILHTARQKGVSLTIRNAYVDASVPMCCTRDNFDAWSKDIISKYGAPDIPAYQRRHEAVKQCTEAPILFVFNKPFRSNAVMVDWKTRMVGEMSIISSQGTVHTIIHELLHQFGAVDLYYPREVKELVQRLNYESVMATANTTYIDSLTAYLIGWTNEIDAPAVYILERTKHLTREDMIEAIRREYAKG